MPLQNVRLIDLPKITDERGLTEAEAHRRCQQLNAELTPAQKKRGTKFEYERE